MNTFGESVKITVFGESHGAALGVVLDGAEAGFVLDFEHIARELARRAPGTSELATPRREADSPEFLSGILNGVTTGAPICAIIRNSDTRSRDYTPNTPRPSHTDLTAHLKYHGFSDYRGGGHFSGRLTAAFVLVGAICKQMLERSGIGVTARIIQVGNAHGDTLDEAMRGEIRSAKAAGDSVGAVIECVATGVPGGIGGLMFGGMESRMAAMLYAVPGVKGVEFGAGFALAAMRGSTANDPIRADNGRIYTETNHAGGLNGGITNGMPIVARVALRPTPSIASPQKTVDLETGDNITMTVAGRHDPCLAPRALPVIEACLAFCILDAVKG
ncbi:MAG: chorismate synthase [Ruminococcaceae bacterium]|nr:chorismate synthase [Oscillospiraceae bacterium]